MDRNVNGMPMEMPKKTRARKRCFWKDRAMGHGKVWRAIGCFRTVIMVFLLVANFAEAKTKDKSAPPKDNALTNYIHRMMGTAQAPAPSSLGSLWVDNGRMANLVSDYKASRVGDLVTINISQNLSSTNTGNVATSRALSASSGITALGGHITTSGVANLFSPNSNQALTGKAQASSTTALSTTLTGRVAALLPSGTLVVEAERQIVMNNQRETVIVRGLVRPGDLDATNTVASNSVGNLEVEVKGKGVISEGVRPPNVWTKWFLRIFGF
ncbi:MAG: flagellar basal body L-ring protein FlgH [Candidatus Sulfotelmatobacter sp.]